MRRAFIVAMAAVGMLTGVQAADAQAVNTQPAPAQSSAPLALRSRAPLLQQQNQRERPRTLVTIFGLPVAISSPVQAPYCNCAYRTFAGQPMTGRDAIFEQAIGGGD